MSIQVFLLDSNATGYASALVALKTYNDAHFNFTTTQTVRSASHDSTLKIIFANVSEAELNADGDLANLRTANFPTELCRDRWIDLQDFRDRGFHTLGESIRSTDGETGKSLMFVRQNSVTATPSAWGEGTGQTPYDAADGWGDTTTLGSTYDRDVVYYGLGCTWKVRNGGANDSTQNTMPAMSTGGGDALRLRMDHPLMPGLHFLGQVDITNFGSSTWEQPDAGNFPRVWTCDYNNDPSSASGIFLLPIDPTLSTSDIYTNHIFGEASSQSELETNEFTAWLDSGVLWVHMPNDNDPTNYIGLRRAGYSFAGRYMNNATRVEDIEFINCQMVGGAFSGSMNDGHNATGNGYLYPKVQFLGGRYLYRTSWKPTDSILDGTKWGRSTTGRILWDTSDRPDPDTDSYIAITVSEHGSDATIWAEMDHFIEIDSATEGIYHSHGGTTNNPDYSTVSGALIRNIGDPHDSILALHGNTLTLNDGDSHPYGNQGGSNCTVEFLYTENFGTAVNWYCADDASSSQYCQNNIIQDFVIHTSHNKYSVSTAGMNGIIMGNDGQGPRTDGSGVKTGCIIRRGYVGNIIGDPTAVISGGVIDGNGISYDIEQGLALSEVTIESCTNLTYSTCQFTTDSTYSDNPAILDSQVDGGGNIRFLTPLQYFFWHRLGEGTGDWRSSSPANLGYLRLDNNLYRFPVGGNATTDELWRFATTTYNQAGWKALSKASPPGTKASIYDPNSTFEVAA